MVWYFTTLTADLAALTRLKIPQVRFIRQRIRQTGFLHPWGRPVDSVDREHGVGRHSPPLEGCAGPHEETRMVMEGGGRPRDGLLLHPPRPGDPGSLRKER